MESSSLRVAQHSQRFANYIHSKVIRLNKSADKMTNSGNQIISSMEYFIYDKRARDCEAQKGMFYPC